MKTLGFHAKMKDLVGSINLEGFLLSRVIIEHRERYTIQSEQGIFTAEITGNLRFSASSRLDFPAVGDWVKAMQVDAETAIILEILPRFSILQRQAIGQHGESQVIATNIDGAFIVQSFGHDFNLNRLERYLTICHGAGIEPYIILTKTDLTDPASVATHLEKIKGRVSDVPILPISSMTGEGYEELKALLKPENTYCFLGSSGVGKSTLVNGLLGEGYLKTSEVSTSTAKGRHTTSHRELIMLPNHGVIIDTPGMRELGMTDQAEGLEQTYEIIHELAETCRFKDCTHITEEGCAVLEALENDSLDAGLYENFMKLQREQEHYTATVREKRAKSKQQGKLYKSIQRANRKNKLK